MKRLRRTSAWIALALLPLACGGPSSTAAKGGGPASDSTGDAGRAAERMRMVERQIAARGVDDPRVLDALRRVPRHRFVPQAYRGMAYADRPLPLSEGQTISQPYIVARMSEAAAIEPSDRVLEIGTGSGYQAAILAELAGEVFSIEIVASLAKSAEERLAALGYRNVRVRHGDGYAGWPDEAPFDAIVVTAAPDHVPPALKEQLAVGGRLVIPVGDLAQELRVIERTVSGFEERTLAAVRFVPMTGEAQD